MTIQDASLDQAVMSPGIAQKLLAAYEKLAGGGVQNGVLSAREKEVLKLIAYGHPYKVIADKLGITIDGVKKHAHSIYRKLGVHSRTDAA